MPPTSLLGCSVAKFYHKPIILLSMFCMFITSNLKASCLSRLDELITNNRPKNLAPLISTTRAVQKDSENIVSQLKDLSKKASKTCKGSKDKLNCVQKEVSYKFQSSTFKRSLSAFKGEALRSNPVCLKNFMRIMAQVWSFQLIAYTIHNSVGNEKMDYPFDLMVGAGVFIWAAEELNCRAKSPSLDKLSINNLKEFKKHVFMNNHKNYKTLFNSYIKENYKLAKDHSVIILLNMMVLPVLAFSEDIIRYEVDKENRESPYEAKQAKTYLKDAMFSGAHSFLYSLPLNIFLGKKAFELRGLPAMKTWMSSRPNIGATLEWSYRLGIGLWDQWFVLKIREDSFLFFNPTQWSETAIRELEQWVD